jgi:hypothetical protein
MHLYAPSNNVSPIPKKAHFSRFFLDKSGATTAESGTQYLLEQ